MASTGDVLYYFIYKRYRKVLSPWPKNRDTYRTMGQLYSCISSRNHHVTCVQCFPRCYSNKMVYNVDLVSCHLKQVLTILCVNNDN